MAGDFNGDRCTDLAAINPGSDDVSVWLGSGDGTFQTQVWHTAGLGSFAYVTALVAGDFNGDGRTDLAAINQVSSNPVSDDLLVLLSNRDGTFQTQVWHTTQAPATAELGSFAHLTALVAADFNGDKIPDLAVASSNDNGSSDVSVLLGNRDGAFPDQVQHTAVLGSLYALVAGDFDGDRRNDLAAINPGSSYPVADDLLVLLGNGDGTFQVQYAAARFGPYDYVPVSGLVAGDFNGDSRTDLAVAILDHGGTFYAVSVLLSNGKRKDTFPDQVQYPVDVALAAVGPGALVAGDFNGDRYTDLAVISPTSNDVSVWLANGNGDGTFQDRVRNVVLDAGGSYQCPRSGGLQRRPSHRPGLGQVQPRGTFRLRRVGVARQRRRHLPDPGAERSAVRGGARAIRHRGEGLQRRWPHRPGC